MSLLILASLCQAQELTFVVVGDMQTDGNHSSINWNVFPQMVEGTLAGLAWAWRMTPLGRACHSVRSGAT